jgi:NitT/TauT family transport system ATP-binding protein
MDEPFSAVDALTRGALQDELLRIWSASGAAILFVTHDIAEAALLSERVIVLSGQPARIALDRRVTLPLQDRREEPGFVPLVTDIQEAL